jgi:hypothetical protein
MQKKSKAKLMGDVALTKGEVYFFVTYPDVKMCYPLIESYVYLGMNFSDEDLEDTWYFQWASDFSKHGSALEGTERPVFCAKKDELHEFQNADQLASTIELAANRRVANRLRSGKL